MSTLRLHAALSGGVMSLEELEAIISQGPHCLREKDALGKLPLHIAAEINVSRDVIMCLIGKHSHALMASDNGGMLPIHHLAKSCSDLAVFEEVGSLFPECFKTKDHDGWLPIHHAARDNHEVSIIQYLVRAYAGGLCIRTLHSSLPLHCAAHHSTSSDAVKYLVDQYPEALREPGKQGMLPLHYAARSNASMEVIQGLTNAYSVAVEAKDSAGRLPVHYATRNSTLSLEIVSYFAEISPQVLHLPDQNGWLCLHYAARFGSNSKLLEYLTKAYPRAVIERDREGWLPIHHAALGSTSVDGLKALAETHPAVVLARAGSIGKFPHDLAPAGSSKQIFLWALYLAFNDSDSSDTSTAGASPSTLPSTNQPASQVSVLRVHIVGDSLAGKSTMRHWLASSGALGVADYSGRWGEWFEKATHDISSLHGRTLGAEVSVANVPVAASTSSPAAASSTSKQPLGAAAVAVDAGSALLTPAASLAPPGAQRQLIIYDYGGNEMFHSFIAEQARYFSRQDIRDHLYVVVIPLFDTDGKVKFSGPQLKTKLLRWLKVLQSSISKESRRYVMIVVNTFASEGVDFDGAELGAMLLREIRRHYTFANLSDGESAFDMPNDFVLLSDIQFADVRSKVQCRAIVESIQTHYFAVCTNKFTHSRLYAHVCKLLDSINMSTDMLVEDYRGIVCSSIQSFYTQKGNVGLGLVDNEVCGYLYDKMIRLLVMSDRVRLIHYPERFVACDFSNNPHVLITSPGVLLSSLYGEMLYNIYHHVHGVRHQSSTATRSSVPGGSTSSRFVLPISTVLKISSQFKSSNLIKLLIDLRICIPVLYNADSGKMRGADTLDIFFNHSKYSLDSTHCLCFLQLLDQTHSTEELDGLHLSVLNTLQATGDYAGIARAYMPQHPNKAAIPPGYFSSLCFLLYMKFNATAEDFQISKNAFYLCTADKSLLLECFLLDQGDLHGVVVRIFSRTENVYHLLTAVEREMASDYNVGIRVFCLQPLETINSIQMGMRSCDELEEDWLIESLMDAEKEGIKQLLFGGACSRSSEQCDASQSSNFVDDSSRRVALFASVAHTFPRNIAADSLARALLATSKELTAENQALRFHTKRVLVHLHRSKRFVGPRDEDNESEETMSRHSLELLWTDVLHRSQALSAQAQMGGMPVGLKAITFPVVLPVLTRVPADGSVDNEPLCAYRLSFMCAVCGKQCLQCGRDQQEYSLLSLGEVGPDILAALAPSVCVLEALVAVKNPPRLVLEWASALQDTLDIMLSYAIEAFASRGLHKTAGPLEIFRDRDRLQRIQRGMFTMIKSFLSPSGKPSSPSADSDTSGGSVLGHIKGYVPPDIVYDAHYVSCVRTLFSCVGDSNLMHTGLQILCSSGVYALVCSGSAEAPDSKGSKKPIEETGQPKPLAGANTGAISAKSATDAPNSSQLCIDQFLKRGGDALAYNIVM